MRRARSIAQTRKCASHQCQAVAVGVGTIGQRLERTHRGGGIASSILRGSEQATRLAVARLLRHEPRQSAGRLFNVAGSKIDRALQQHSSRCVGKGATRPIVERAGKLEIARTRRKD